MAYRIEYELQYLKQKKIRQRKRPNSILKTVIFLLVAVIASYVFSVYFQYQAIGKTHSLMAASEQLVQDLKTGVTVSEAVETFCDGLIK